MSYSIKNPNKFDYFVVNIVNMILPRAQNLIVLSFAQVYRPGIFDPNLSQLFELSTEYTRTSQQSEPKNQQTRFHSPLREVEENNEVVQQLLNSRQHVFR